MRFQRLCAALTAAATLLALAPALAQQPRPYVRPPDPFFMRDFVIEYFFETELREGTFNRGDLYDQMAKFRGVGCEYIPMLTDGLPFEETQHGTMLRHTLFFGKAHIRLSCGGDELIFSSFFYPKKNRSTS